MSNIAFSGDYREWLDFKLPTSSPLHGYIYAFFFTNGFAKVGGSHQPHARLQQLLETFDRSSNTEAVMHVVVTPLIVEYIQQEKALHKLLPQENRRFEYFQIGPGEYCEILQGICLKRDYSADEVKAQAASAARANSLMDSVLSPLRAGLEYKTQADEFGYPPKGLATLRLIAKAIQSSDSELVANTFDMASMIIDGMPESADKEDIAAIYCACAFAIGKGLQQHAANISLQKE